MFGFKSLKYYNLNPGNVGTFFCFCFLIKWKLKEFQIAWANVLWVSGVLVLEFAPILAWYRFSSCWSVCDHLWCIFNLMMCQMFSICEISGLQVGQFSTWTLLLWSHAVIIAAVCAFALSCWNTHHLEGSICCSKTFIYLSAFIVPYKTRKLPIPCAQWQKHANDWCSVILGPEDHRRPKVFGLVPYAQRFLQFLWIFW